MTDNKNSSEAVASSVGSVTPNFVSVPAYVEPDSCEAGPDQPRGLGLVPVPSTYQPASFSEANPTLAELTTMGVGGSVEDYRKADTEADFMEAARNADESDQPLLVVGGGSNILAGPEGFDGLVLQSGDASLKVLDNSGCGGVTVEVGAAYPWDAFVCQAIENEWMGVEALSGIPGTVGAAPVQNIGAYGQEVAETIESVRVYDRLTQRPRQLALIELGFGYRTAVLKRSMHSEKAGGGKIWGPSPRYLVLSVRFQMRHASLSAPIRYQQLADNLGVKIHDRVDAADVRRAVLELRASKGMVLDPEDRDTHSAGSFFTNPIIPEDVANQLPAEAPRFPVLDTSMVNNIGKDPQPVPGVVKTSAAWLIQHAGFGKGYTLEDVCQPKAALSTKHVLALTNRGSASADDIVALARAIRDGVRERFGITLEPEPVQVGLSI